MRRLTYLFALLALPAFADVMATKSWVEARLAEISNQTTGKIRTFSSSCPDADGNPGIVTFTLDPMTNSAIYVKTAAMTNGLTLVRVDDYNYTNATVSASVVRRNEIWKKLVGNVRYEAFTEGDESGWRLVADTTNAVTTAVYYFTTPTETNVIVKPKMINISDRDASIYRGEVEQ